MWFGLSNYSRHGTYLEGRMRSHPLLAKLGNEAVPSTAIQGTVSMLGLDGAYEQKAKSEGSDLYKAADWRCASYQPSCMASPRQCGATIRPNHAPTAHLLELSSDHQALSCCDLH